MGYTSQHRLLHELFSLDKTEMQIPDSTMIIRNMEFISTFSFPQQEQVHFKLEYCHEDAQIQQNWNFSYPVFSPNNKKNNRAIILLHGLNERNWTKYLTWADYLARHTNRTVILFPLAFHMNRGKKEWSDPRSMNVLANSRKNSYDQIVQLSFANAALSNRLTQDTMRFYRAGLQSAHDLFQLLNQIKLGQHPLLEKNTQVNFMGYSIGAFLTQILFMANPGNIFKDSKAVLFCGGTTFNKMMGASKLIMDNLAYKNLLGFYVKKFENKMLTDPGNYLSHKLNSVIQAFKAMIPLPSFSTLKESAFSQLSEKILTIGLLKDQVMPANYIKETLKNKRGRINFKVMFTDFPYNYSHENPFPVFHSEKSELVDQSFEQIFRHIAISLK